VFVTVGHFHPSLIFKGEAGALTGLHSRFQASRAQGGDW